MEGVFTLITPADQDEQGNSDSEKKKEEMGQADNVVATITTTYLIAVSLFLLYSLYAIWPPPANYPSPRKTIRLTADNATQPTITGTKVRYLFTLENQDLTQNPVTFTAFGIPNSVTQVTFEPKLLPATLNPSRIQMTVDAAGLADSTYILMIYAKQGTSSSVALVPLIVQSSKPRIPTPQETLVTTQTAVQPTGSSNPAPPAVVDPRPVTYFRQTHLLFNETRLWLVVLICGALGATLHGLRSLYWYMGNGGFRVRWAAKYVLQPIAGGILGLGFYFMVRGGFFANTTGASDTSSHSFAALAFLMGLFSEQAVEKLLQVFNTLFAAPTKGQDTVLPTSTAPTSPAATPDFSITATTTDQAAPADLAPLTYPLTVSAGNGFNGTVTLSATGPLKADGSPAFSFSTASVVPTANGIPVQFQVNPQGLTAGPHTITITAKSGTVSHDVVVKLTVPGV